MRAPPRSSFARARARRRAHPGLALLALASLAALVGPACQLLAGIDEIEYAEASAGASGASLGQGGTSGQAGASGSPAQAGAGSPGGSAGQAGSGAGGSSGVAGEAGVGGASGQSGQAGQAGQAGAGGAAGAAGAAGATACEGNFGSKACNACTAASCCDLAAQCLATAGCLECYQSTGSAACSGGEELSFELLGCQAEHCAAACGLPGLACQPPASPPSAGSCAKVGGVNQCNPVTGEPCSNGKQCDASFDNQGAFTGFVCFSPPNEGTLCGPCGFDGTTCGNTLSCFNSRCMRYCCSDADCGEGAYCATDLPLDSGGFTIGLCSK